MNKKEILDMCKDEISEKMLLVLINAFKTGFETGQKSPSVSIEEASSIVAKGMKGVTNNFVESLFDMITL